jgi:hypothetical protein
MNYVLVDEMPVRDFVLLANTLKMLVLTIILFINTQDIEEKNI